MSQQEQPVAALEIGRRSGARRHARHRALVAAVERARGEAECDLVIRMARSAARGNCARPRGCSRASTRALEAAFARPPTVGVRLALVGLQPAGGDLGHVGVAVVDEDRDHAIPAASAASTT
jgi:hypothetical protein